MSTLLLFLRGASLSVDYVVVALVTLQSLFSVATIAIVAMFSERQASLNRLEKAARFFLKEELMNNLSSKVWLFAGEDVKFAKVSRINLNLPESLVAWYKLELEGKLLFMHVWFNLQNILVIYYLPLEGTSLENQREGLSHVFQGFASEYYTISEQKETVEPYPLEGMGIYLHSKEKLTDILIDPSARLFWINDICSMTRSIFRQAQLGRVLLWDTNILTHIR